MDTGRDRAVDMDRDTALAATAVAGMEVVDTAAVDTAAAGMAVETAAEVAVMEAAMVRSHPAWPDMAAPPNTVRRRSRISRVPAAAVAAMAHPSRRTPQHRLAPANKDMAEVVAAMAPRSLPTARQVKGATEHPAGRPLMGRGAILATVGTEEEDDRECRAHVCQHDGVA